MRLITDKGYAISLSGKCPCEFHFISSRQRQSEMGVIMEERGKEAIRNGQAILGMEFGSTRIKAVLIDDTHQPLAVGVYDWENRLENHIWTYRLEDIRKGLQGCYASLKKQVMEKYGEKLTRIAAMGFSGMMHGYMPFDRNGKLLVPFRTWRNTMTAQAAGKLTDVFQFPIPQRWSIAHLYQAILNEEEHVKEIAHMTTLAGYIHWQLTGEKILGVGEASGMFPVDTAAKDFDPRMLQRFDALVEEKKYQWKLRDILPKIKYAGECAGKLTQDGALFLDPDGDLLSGALLCPPEGDAGTGMVATDSVAVRTGNVSAGTSVFAMVVLEHPLSKMHEELDMVTTPAGDPVAMAHCNNCTSDLNTWVELFREFAEKIGMRIEKDELYRILFRAALDGRKDCGGLLSYNYDSGEPVTGLEEGRPLFVRRPDADFSLANFMRTHLYSSLASLKIGMDILLREENVKVDSLTGHGGLFKTPEVGQSILAAALNVPITVMDTAGEGGAWGMAILAQYMAEKKGESLAEYLSEKTFADRTGTTMRPDTEDVAGFETFIRSYIACLPVEKAAVNFL